MFSRSEGAWIDLSQKESSLMLKDQRPTDIGS